MTNRCRWVCAAIVMTVALPGAVFAQAAKATSPAASTAQPAAKDDAQALNLKAYVELMRSDLRTHKVALITEVMQLSDAEDQAFWPVYRDYENKLARLNDERLRGIETYARNYNALTDAVATDLATKALDLEARRVALKQEYFNRLKTVVSPVTAARALQVENQILLLLDLQVASSLPVAGK